MPSVLTPQLLQGYAGQLREVWVAPSPLKVCLHHLPPGALVATLEAMVIKAATACWATRQVAFILLTVAGQVVGVSRWRVSLCALLR